MRRILLTIGVLAAGTTLWAQVPQQAPPANGGTGAPNGQQPQPNVQNNAQPNVQNQTGMAVGGALPPAAQAPQTRTRVVRRVAPPPRPDYSLYGGPHSRSEAPVTRGERTPTIGPIYP